MNKIKIEKLDNLGRGICFLNNKITFVKNALPEEIVDIKTTKETKKFNEATVTKYYKTSPKRIAACCPNFNICGGCNLLNLSYAETIEFKKEKLRAIFHKYSNLDYKVDIIPSRKTFNYRNKITLKVINNQYGYYENSTHTLVEISECSLAEEAIKNFFPDIKQLNIKDGELTIRSNYNNELLIWIKSPTQIKPNISYLIKKHKIVGIIWNDQVLYGESSFVEIVAKKIFKVSYDSFFQINRNICEKLFSLIQENVKNSNVILDLYCGVGSLGIAASSGTNKIYGIEIIKNAVLNSITNAKINKISNAYYLLGEVSKCLNKIEDKIDTIIVDPPRAGLDNKTIATITNFKPQKLIYISCDPMTLARDLKSLEENFIVNKIVGLDMFPYTHHVETMCVLNSR